MRGHDRFRALVAGQRGERRVAGAAEADRMPALPAVKRRRDRRALRRRRRDARDRRRHDPRHVGERDDPAGRVLRRRARRRRGSRPCRRRHSRSGRCARRPRRAPRRAPASSGRTTAITRGSATSRWRHAMAPTHSPARPAALPPPKRVPRPARAACRPAEHRDPARRRQSCSLDDQPLAVLQHEVADEAVRRIAADGVARDQSCGDLPLAVLDLEDRKRRAGQVAVRRSSDVGGDALALERGRSHITAIRTKSVASSAAASSPRRRRSTGA